MESKKRSLDITPSPFLEPEPRAKRQKTKHVEQGDVEIISLKEYKDGEFTKQDMAHINEIVCRSQIASWVMEPTKLKFDMTILARQNSEIIGICSFNFLDDDKTVAILYLLCSKATGAQKIGQKLIVNMIKRLKSSSINLKYILVEPVPRAIEFYQKQGFIVLDDINLDLSHKLNGFLETTRKQLQEKEEKFEETHNEKISDEFKSHHYFQYLDILAKQITTNFKNEFFSQNHHRMTWIDDIFENNTDYMVLTVK